MRVLHDQAPVHGWKHTQKELEMSFGPGWISLFLQLDQKPLASGSVAQVKAVDLAEAGAIAGKTGM